MFINIYYNVERIEAWSRSWVASQYMHEPRPRDICMREIGDSLARGSSRLSRVCDLSVSRVWCRDALSTDHAWWGGGFKAGRVPRPNVVPLILAHHSGR